MHLLVLKIFRWLELSHLKAIHWLLSGLLALKVDVISLIKMKDIKVISIVIDRPVINALVLKNGKANWDIMKPSGPGTPSDTSKSSTKFVIKLKKFYLKNANISI